MDKIIKAAVDRGASDLHMKAGDMFRARINGKLVALSKQKLTPDQTRSIALHLMTNEDDKARLDKILDYDCSWAAAGIGRFRVNIMRQRGSFSIIMRVIPWEVPTFEVLGLPPVLASIAEAERGMILVTGVTGSGKSSTMAALINYINVRHSRHILTLENPIEFLHNDRASSVTQREIGSDTADFKMGLRAALRQDPDVIMIGEMRDGETVDTAIKAAETGHLLMSTLHTPDAQSTILRIMAMFPPEEQDVIRIRLAESLYAVISQRLLPTTSGNGRAVATEVMINTPTIKDVILEGTRIGMIRDYIAEGREQYGMQTFDQCLTDLVQKGVVSFETAKAAASNPSDFELRLKMFSRLSHPAASDDVVQEEAATAPATSTAGDGSPSGDLDFLTSS
ncbi:MAG TPA: type IV pilus twitching motility protein PilT [Gemmatimonadaceae bacterium]